jgi:hypothetical protein
MHAKLQPRASLRSALMFGVVMLAAIGALRSAAKADQDDDAERVPSSAADIYSPIQSTFTPQAPLPGGPQRLVPGTSFPADDGPVLFQDLKERLRFADPFFRDMKLAVYLRTHDLDRDNATGPRSRAWAGGSALASKTGYLDDWLQLEAAGATSQPLFAPEGEGGTLLLTQNQAEVSSFAIANARMRFTGLEAVLGRQLFKTPYINPQDNRMLPNAVEGAVITRRRDEAQTLNYGVGYLWGFKTRDSSHFLPFSDELGVTEDRGVLAAGAKVVPIEGLTLGAIDYWIADVLNTTFAEADWIIRATSMQFRVSVNYTNQRTVGADLIAGRAVRDEPNLRALCRKLCRCDAACRRLAHRRRCRVTRSVRQLPCLYRARPARLQPGGRKERRGRRRLRFVEVAHRRTQGADPLRLGLGRRRCAERQAADAAERVRRRARIPARVRAF